MTMPVELVEIQSRIESERSPEEQAKLDSYLANQSDLLVGLSDMANRNAREALTNRLLLALLEGTPPDPEDVATLRRTYDVVDQSPMREELLGVASVPTLVEEPAAEPEATEVPAE